MRHFAPSKFNTMCYSRRGRSLNRRGFSLIEAITAVVIVTISCSAMLFSVSQAMQASDSSQAMNRANLLAQDLMNEISARRWSDPENPAHWGLEDGENTSANRAQFDDLDDYDRWSGPPQSRSGVLYDTLQHQMFPAVHSSDYSQYRCSVRVEPVSVAGQVSVNETAVSPYRRVTVQVAHPQIRTVTITRTFVNLAPLLGRANWYDPQVVEPKASVTIIAAPSSTTTSGTTGGSTDGTSISDTVDTAESVLGH